MTQTKVEAPFVQNNANFRNLIINGDMKIAQRNTSETGIGASAGYFTLDRYQIQTANSAGRLTMSQTAITDLSGFTQSLKLDCTTADTSIAAGEYLMLTQMIEGQNLQQLKKGTSDAEKVTVSFYVKGNASATYAAEIYDLDNDRHASKTFAVTTSWNRISLTYDGDTTGAFTYDSSAAIQFNIWLHAGSTYTGGTLQSSFAGANAGGRAVGISSFYDSTDREFFITGLQIEVGDQATDFEHLPIDIQLHRCRRYFQMFSNTHLDTAYDNEGLFTGTLYTGSAIYGHFQLNPNMRTTPALYEVNGTNYYVAYTNNSNDTFDDLNINSNGSSAQNMEVYTGAGDGLSLGSGGQSVFVRTHNNATRLGVDAEF